MASLKDFKSLIPSIIERTKAEAIKELKEMTKEEQHD